MFEMFFIIVIISQIDLSASDPLVALPNGQIRGRLDITLEGKTFYAFERIPYATPPIGNLRFKAPQPAQDWDGILDTTYTTTVCRQATSNTIFETEDCLYINVFTPQLPGGDGNVSFPVIFYIHGGGFISGTSIIFGPDNFINNDVILVSFNYRLGPYGFLSTQDEIIPGNNGLKDQLLALKWTHNNIKLFGGDPEKITLFGVSAGSASCAYHLLNHQSKGLFRGAILESGSSLSPWAYQRNARKIAFKTASFLNSTFETNNDSTALLEYLQSVDASDLDAAAEKYYDMENGPENIEISQGFYWAPVLEVKNSEAFITEKMYGLFQSGNVVVVPIIIGITSEESLLFNPDANVLKATLQAYDEHLDWLVPNDMRILNSTNRVEMGRLIREIYTQGEPLSDYLGNGIRYSSDTSFTRSVIKTAELLSKVSETYFYQFSYDGKMGHFDIHYDGAETVAHAEETSYLFCAGFGCDFSGYPELDQIVQKRLITIWTNFAKYLNPTPQPSDLLQNITWPLLDAENGNFFYVDIGENLTIKNHPKKETYKQWELLYSSLGYDDFDTY